MVPSEHSNGKGKVNKVKAKAAVAVKDANKFEMEHCEISFMNENDRALFIKAFN